MKELPHTVEMLDNLLVDTIRETLERVFREAGTKVIYNYLKNNFHLKLEEIPRKPEDFSVGLERLLGSGAPVIETLILKKLYCYLDLRFTKKEGYELSDHIKELKQNALFEA